jgi:hypothetical protein
MQKISAALVKFQSQLKPVAKEAENPFFKSSYADLSSILKAVIPVLTSNGLAVIQPLKVVDDRVILITKLIHESGETIESEMILPHNADPQKYGSLITYYKRYQIQALLGINTEEDDDGNSVSKPVYSQPKTPEQRIADKPTFQVEGIGQQRPMTGLASDAQKNALRKMGIKFSEEITKQEASELIAQNNKRI